MKIDAHTSQEQLLKLSEQVLRRDLLQSTPLNIKFFLRYLILFLLFPGMVFGYKVGISGTAVLAGVAAYLWLWSTPQALDSFLWFWIIWAAVDWVLLGFRLLAGVWQYLQFKSFLHPEDAGVADLQPGGHVTHELEPGDNFQLPLVVQTPRRHVCVLKVLVEDGNSRIGVGFDGCACMEEHEVVPGLVNTHAAAYRLEPGCHRLTLLVQPQAAGKLHVSFR